MAKTVALGTVLKMENPATTGTITIGNLTSISVPGPSHDEYDVTDFDSVAKEFLPDLPDFGEIAFEGFFNNTNAGQAAAYADANQATPPTREYVIEITPQNVKFTFDAWMKTFVPNASDRGPVTFSGSLRVTGAVVKAALP